MLIFIIGYMGAGKTSLGNRLAKKLNYTFHDLDEMIVTSTGYAILDYFEKFGEESFRQKERLILQNHLDDIKTVIATGGGTPCYADNMELMNQSGITVFIEISVETILERLGDKITQRPLLRKIPPGQLPGFIREHLGNRMAFYSKAKIKIEGEKVDLDLLIEATRSKSES